ALFIMVNNIINRINDPAKKIAMKEKLSYFLEVKEIFEINDQKKAWEHLENKQEILTKPTDISYEDLRKVLWGVYELMRDAYYDIDENVLFELEEKAEGNVKDYYSMMLMTVLKSYGIHGKERKLTESKFEQYKNVIENFAKRTKDSKMKTACENALKIAKNSTK
ncbi:MAG: hypothetical protein L6407_06790, partial [Candidatus Delongbacteria bacterium]|nr:hypothetical protein [Candidatus Delongbacteria bacterium]